MGRELGPGSGRMAWCYVCVSLDYLCRWQVQVSVYCTWRIPAHLRCTLLQNNNSQGTDKFNIRHQKHIGPLGLAFLTSMFKTALNKNIILHTWKLANITSCSTWYL